MIQRSKRRNRIDIKLKSSGGMLDLFDNFIKQIFRINDTEYDFIIKRMTDEEISILIPGPTEMTYSEKRQCIIILEKYMNEFKNRNQHDN